MYKISGLDGTRAVKMSDVTASAMIGQKDQFGNRKVRPMHGWLKPLPLANRTDETNRGGVRGVLPCGSAWNYYDVLRRPAGNKMTGLYPQQGAFRNQPRGLAWQPEKPINQPIMKLTSSVYAGIPSSIPGRY